MSDWQYRQFEPSHRGWTVAVLDTTVGELHARGFHFEYAFDDLDEFLFSIVPDANVGEFWLLKRLHSPEAGVQVQVDSTITTSAALAAVKSALGLEPHSMNWISPDEQDPDSSVPDSAWNLTAAAR